MTNFVHFLPIGVSVGMILLLPFIPLKKPSSSYHVGIHRIWSGGTATLTSSLVGNANA